MTATSLVCAGCGWTAPAGALAFRCAQVIPDDGIDHVLRRALDRERVTFPASRESNPFIRYRQLLHSYHVALGQGLSDADFVALVQRLDREAVRVDGQGFVVTPCAAHDRLGARLGFGPGRLLVKDETGNVSGSHKARHLFGVMLGLMVAEAAEVRLKPDPTTDVGAQDVRAGGSRPVQDVGVSVSRPAQDAGASFSRPALAIASCGNAALAAAVVARAAGRTLDVFVPTWADERVIARLRQLGARITTCPRDPDVPGDPCYHRFHEAVDGGAVPFCCQGPDNGLTIEGGSTIAWEMIDIAGDRAIDRVFVQVGGGALASACARGFADALALGRIRRLPRLHAVQTEGGFPLKRAYDLVVERVNRRLGSAELKFRPTPDTTAELKFRPTPDATAALKFRPTPDTMAELKFRPTTDRPTTDRAAGPKFGPATGSPTGVGPNFSSGDLSVIRDELHYAATHRAEFMWPWDTPPCSIATGILDDETYDWLAVVEGMLLSGGYPIVVSEDTLKAANTLALQTTGVPVDHTGTAGLAGLIQAIEGEPRLRDETVAVIFSGVTRQ